MALRSGQAGGQDLMVQYKVVFQCPLALPIGWAVERSDFGDPTVVVTSVYATENAATAEALRLTELGKRRP
jgi:hypothetical protein